MTAILYLLLAIAIGCAAMWRPLGCLMGSKPRWAVIALMMGGGAAFGIGATSIVFFVTDLLAPGFRWVELAIEIAVLAWLIYASVQRRRKMERPDAEPVGTGADSNPESKLRSNPKSPNPKSRNPKSQGRGPLNPMIAGTLLVVLLLATGAMGQAWDRNPQGNWDAWSIWNLRAKFLAAPNVGPNDVAPNDMGSNRASRTPIARAWSPLLTETHPEYPLLLSAAIARCWGLPPSGPAVSDIVPIAIGYTFFLSLIAVVTGGIAIARGALAGLIAGLTLAASGALLHEVPSQYADVPLAAYLGCAVVFLLIDSSIWRPIWAGVFAGFAAWTKDEGAMFCVVLAILLAAACVWDRPRRREFPRVILGMLPGALTFGLFKAFLAPHVTAQFSAGVLSRLANMGRWEVVLAGVASQIASLGAGWFHPVFIVAAFAIGAGFRVDSRRDPYFPALLCSALAVAMLGGYCAAMVTSPDDSAWQTGTAAGRLMVQWWPLAVIAIMMWLRPAEELAVEQASVKKRR